MANDRFLETQRVQTLEMDRIKKILTIEQLQTLGQEPQEKKDHVALLTPPSPSTAKRFLNKLNKKENVKPRKSSEPKRSLASLVQRNPKSNSLPSSPSLLDVSILITIVKETSPVVLICYWKPCLITFYIANNAKSCQFYGFVANLLSQFHKVAASL